MMSLLFNMLSRFVTAFLPKSKSPFISCLQSPSSVVLEPKKINSITVSIFSSSICHEVMGPDAMILAFWMSYKPNFSLSSFIFIKRLFSSSSLSATRVVLYAYMLLLLSRFSHVRLCATPETAAHQDPPSLGFSRQEYWSGLPFPSLMHESEKWKWSHSVVSNSQWPHRLQPTRLLRPWDFLGKSTGVGCHCLLCCKHEVTFISPGNLDASLCFISLASHIIYSVCKLNKQGDNIQPWYTPFPILNQFIVSCLILTVALWPHTGFSCVR